MKPNKITTTAVAILAFGASAQTLALPAVGNHTTSEKEISTIKLGNLDGAVKSKKITEEDYFYLQIAGPLAPGDGPAGAWEKLLDIIFDVDDEEEKEKVNS